MMKNLFAKGMLCVSALLIGCAMLALPAYAAPEDETESTATEPAATTAFDPQQYLSTYSTVSTYDYYSDPYYDTDGNAELIQRVIYASAQLQFISVTTKDGHVFYIIIDYTDTDGNNVYFLNKVDDFDLYALLYQGDDDADTALDSYRSQQSNLSTAETGDAQDGATATTTKVVEEAEKQSGSTSETMVYLVGGGVFVIALIAIVLLRLRSMKNNRIAPNDDFADDDDDDDIDGGDEIEIR